MSTYQFLIGDLPTELQRAIFITAARTQTSCALSLALVARCVNTWVQPCIYEMVTLGSQDASLFMRTACSKPREFFAMHVKRLCLSVSVSAEDATRILSVCTGVDSLAFWVDFLDAIKVDSISLASLIAPLPLRKLSIEWTHFLHILQTPVNVWAPWRESLTHLNLIFWTHEVSPMIPGLSLLFSITHLALWLRHDEITNTSLLAILSACKALQVLVIIVDEMEHPSQDQHEVDTVDPRVVLIFYPDAVYDWEAPMRGLPDTWSQAEEIVRFQSQSSKPQQSS